MSVRVRPSAPMETSIVKQHIEAFTGLQISEGFLAGTGYFSGYITAINSEDGFIAMDGVQISDGPNGNCISTCGLVTDMENPFLSDVHVGDKIVGIARRNTHGEMVMVVKKQ